MKMISETKRSVGHDTFLPKWFMILKVAALAGNARRRESQSFPVKWSQAWQDVMMLSVTTPGPQGLTISSRLSAPDVSQAELLLAFSPSRGETNHPLFLSIFRDLDD